MKTSPFSLHPQRGSALVTTMMLSMAVMIVIASILGYSLSERRMNYREAMRLEARNAAEAMAEYGMAQVHDLMQSRYDMSATRFTSSEGSIVKPPDTFWGGSNVATSGTYAPELIIGTVSPVTQGGSSGLYLYSSTDPDNANDPLKGCYAFRYDVKVLAKATVVPPIGGAGGPQTCYMNETLSARASPLFSRAIFYNMDLEIAPGPTMNILGATHTNGNMYIKKQSSSGSGLNFVGPVTVAKNLYAGVKQYLTNTNGTTDDLSSYTDNVYFSTAAGGLTGIYGPPTSGATSIWRDQKWGASSETATTQASFRTWASQTYSGNLQTILHGVQAQVPPGISTYVEDATPANGQDNSINDAHKMIQPPLATGDAGYDADVELQKYATKCGIYICVNPTSTTRNGRTPDGSVISVPARKYRAFAHNTTTNAVYEIILPGQPDYGTNNATVNAGGNRPALVAAAGQNPVITVRINEMMDLRRTTYDYRSPPRSATNPYVGKMLTTIDVDLTALKLAIDYSVSGATTSQVYYTAVPPDGTALTSTLWRGFIYNNTTSGSGSSVLPAATALGTVNQITNLAGGAWNGGIYIESIDAHVPPVLSDFVTANSSYRNGRPTLLSPPGAAPVNEPSGVRLINGRGRLVTAAPNAGLTIATNDACYILGHYNADGFIDSSTTVGNTTNSGRYPETGETPCSVCCDAITLLSTPYYTNSGTTITQRNGWNDALSSLRYSSSTTWSSSWATTAPSNSNRFDGANTSLSPCRIPYDITSPAFASSARTFKMDAGDMEISAAFMAGISISDKDNNNQNSGSANNYPRFIEEFANDPQGLGISQRTVAIRGSIVAMYESRAATEPWNWRLMNAPIRLWGFNQLFANGSFPPLTPIVMDYRRLKFNDITATEYAAYKSAWGVP